MQTKVGTVLIEDDGSDAKRRYYSLSVFPDRVYFSSKRVYKFSRGGSGFYDGSPRPFEVEVYFDRKGEPCGVVVSGLVERKRKV